MAVFGDQFDEWLAAEAGGEAPGRRLVAPHQRGVEDEALVHPEIGRSGRWPRALSEPLYCVSDFLRRCPSLPSTELLGPRSLSWPMNSAPWAPEGREGEGSQTRVRPPWARAQLT